MENTQDSGPAWTSSFGVAGEVVTSANVTSTALVVTDAPATGKKLCLDDLELSVDGATMITLRTTTGLEVLGVYPFAAAGFLQVTTRGKKNAAAADDTLEIISSTAVNVWAGANYHSES
ncbi:hypothetical protein BH11PLA2_BH11PLA2_32480 [soil metagenome]